MHVQLHECLWGPWMGHRSLLGASIPKQVYKDCALISFFNFYMWRIEFTNETFKKMMIAQIKLQLTLLTSMLTGLVKGRGKRGRVNCGNFFNGLLLFLKMEVLWCVCNGILKSVRVCFCVHVWVCECVRNGRCQFYQHKTCAFFIRTSFLAAFSSYMYVVKAAETYVRTKNLYI